MPSLARGLSYVLDTFLFKEMVWVIFKRVNGASLHYISACIVNTYYLLSSYCNMDFIILSALVGVALHWIVITYNIACQWSKNLYKWMGDFPEEMRVSSDTKIGVAIPSWHINGHGESCRQNYNISYMKGAAKTCGEEVEIIWSHTNSLAPSIREMGPAAHHDTLNDHWGGWNFRRIIAFRKFTVSGP